MLLAAVFAVSCAAVQVGGTAWVNAYEFGDSAWTPAASGEYSAYAWAKGGAAVEASIAGSALKGAAPAADKNHAYTWAPLGKVTVEKGKAVAISGADLAAVVLSSEKDFDPLVYVRDVLVKEDPAGIIDGRASISRNLDTVFTMPEYDKPTWEATKDQIRRRLLIGCGLWPMPERTPLNAKVFDRVQHDDYSVEKVYFEARPGFVVTGNLYRPVGNGPFPAVLCPHGHWEKGRLEDTDKCSVPGRCITFARMGMVAFSVDMVGYNDSFQFVHHFLQPAFSLWGIHPFSLQLWSSIRGLDFLESLPEVDKARLACTGASGGGTQTFALCAVDDRVKVSAPVNMISSTMQGGCMCENAPIFRIGVSNMEVGAMMAPRPMMMIAATGDWTRETPRVEYPAIKSIYALYGAEANVETHQEHAGHNYNKPSREAVYRFFGKHLLGGDKWDSFTEPPFTVESEDKLRVFPKGTHPDGFPTAQQVIESIKQERRATWAKHYPSDEESAMKFRTENATLLSDMTAAVKVKPNDLACERVGYEERPDCVVEKWILSRKGANDHVPGILYRSKGPEAQSARVFVSDQGKAAFAAPTGGPGADVKAALNAGAMALVIDAFLLGEENAATARTKRLVEGFQDTYQATDTDYRIQDVLTAVGFLRARRDCTGNIGVTATGEAGLWATFAVAIDGGVKDADLDLSAQPYATDEPWLNTDYIPGVRAAGALTPLYLIPAETAVNLKVRYDAEDAWLPANFNVLQ